MTTGDSPRNLILTGFMGTGKSAVGRLLAEQLGRPFVDTDVLVEEQAGQSINDIFAQQGVAAFRRMESAIVRELAGRTGLVIATGGGALVDPQNRARMMDSGTVVCLSARPEEILARVSDDDRRPLLQVPDPHEAVEQLLAQREAAYRAIPWQIDTTGSSPQAVAERIRPLVDSMTLTATHPSGAYPIHVGGRLLDQLGLALASVCIPLGSSVAVVSNPVVAPLYADRALASLEAAGFAPVLCLVPDGEQHKNLATVAMLYDQFMAGGLDRSATVLALGGGVTGDMAGFAAASFMRGVRFVQVPTTLLSMVDASVGGKTGVDLPQGKNLVGAFKQPEMVLVDPTVLATLPQEEVRAGVAEMLKAGVIDDPELFEALAAGQTDPAGMMPADWIARALRVKIRIVAEDPLERGRRAVLNLGHTVGHALERLSEYELRHGDAVAIGTVAAGRLAVAQGLAEPALADAIEQGLAAWNLPVRCPPLPVDAIWQALFADKKKQGKTLRWIVPAEIGRVEIVDDLPFSLVQSVLLELGARKGASDES